jgi:hypothetical protein
MVVPEDDSRVPPQSLAAYLMDMGEECAALCRQIGEPGAAASFQRAAQILRRAQEPSPPNAAPGDAA